MAEYPECAMLDDLTAQPRYVMFSLAPPTFASAFGRKMDSSIFGHQLKTVPMVHGSEQGLVLYERVSNDKEQSGLQQLARPKKQLQRQPAPAEHKPGTSNRRPQQTDSRPRGAGQASSPDCLHRPTATCPPAAGGEPAAQSPCAASAATTSHAAPTGGGSHEGGAHGAHRGGEAAIAAPPRPRHSGVSKYGIQEALRPSQESGEMRSYVNREKAVMTASHVFTWGGRHTYAGPEHGLSRQTWATQLTKPPLRL